MEAVRDIGHLSLTLLFVTIITSCASQITKHEHQEQTSREIAQIQSQVAQKTARVLIGLNKSGVADEVLQKSLAEILTEKNIATIQNLPNSTGTSFTIAAGKRNAGEKFHFIKNKDGSINLDFETIKGKRVPLSERAIKINPDVATEGVEFTRFKGNLGMEITRIIPATTNSAEVVTFRYDKNVTNYPEFYQSKNSKFAEEDYYRKIASELNKEGLTDAEKKLLKYLNILGFEAVTLSCGKLPDDSKAVIADFLENLSKGEGNPQEFYSWVIAYAKSVKISEPELAKQLLLILKELDCGLKVPDYIDL
jgi:hypothetical protein